MERIALDLLKLIIDIISEIKHGVYGANGKGETFAVSLGCLCKVKVFVLGLEVNIRNGLFVRDIFREKNTKSKKSKWKFLLFVVA